MADPNAQCAHGPCTCTPRTGEAYCCDYCQHAATSGPPRQEPKCECGHPGCGGAHE